MRLVTWNCCRGSHVVNAARVQVLRPDLAVLQESARPDAESAQCRWFGRNPRQGLTLLTSPALALEPLPQRADACDFMIPFRVRGERDFLVLGVWAQKPVGMTYVEGLLRNLRVYRDLVEPGSTVIMGDFNANAIWNHKRAVGRDFAALVRTLEALDLISSYHAFFGEAYGAETQATHFFRHHRNEPFHIDYCFLPQSWRPSLRSVAVGTFEDWQGMSDHRPLTVALS